MMATRDDVRKLIYSAIDEVNAAQSQEHRIAKSPDSILFGEGGSLDSLGLLTFVLQVEQRVQSEGYSDFTLTDPETMADSPVAFRTVDTLSDYIVRRLGP